MCYQCDTFLFQMAQAMHEGADKDAILEAVPELKDVSDDELDFR